jgi:hypothetical protein
MTIDELKARVAYSLQRLDLAREMAEEATRDLADLDDRIGAEGYLPEQIVRWAYDQLYPSNAETPPNAA